MFSVTAKQHFSKLRLLRFCRRSEYARSEMGDGSTVGASGPGDEPGAECYLLPDLPPSWVPKLSVARDMLDQRCPRVRAGTAENLG